MFWNKKKNVKPKANVESNSINAMFNFDPNMLQQGAVDFQNMDPNLLNQANLASDDLNVNQSLDGTSDLKEKKNKTIDYNLVMLVIFLTIFGLVVLYSASSYYSLSEYKNTGYLFERQLGFIGVGLIIMFVVSLFSYKIFYRFGYIIYIVSIAFVIATLIIGTAFRGSTRWIDIFGITFQPSELTKISVIVAMATYFTKHYSKLEDHKTIMKGLMIGLFPAFFIVSNNLSTGIIVILLAFFISFVVSKKYLPFLLLIIAAAGIYTFAEPITKAIADVGLIRQYQLERILAWKNPSEYVDKTYQTLQSLYAVGSGGYLGKGLGSSIQKYVMPEAQNDMIFAILAEEMGLFGSISLLIIFIFIFYRIFVISMNATEFFGSIVAYGVMVHIALQVFLNIAVCLNLIPNTGITLPFISYGGSSSIVLFIEMGLVLSISRGSEKTV